MQLNERYKVKTQGGRQEHVAADPERTLALLDVIGFDPAPCQDLAGHHLITLKQLQAAHLLQVFRCAAKLEIEADAKMAGEKLTRLSGCILASAFIDDPYARTRQSFDNAFLRLGGNVMQFSDRIDDPEDNSAALTELANMCSNYADVAVVRAQHGDTILRMLDNMRIPVISAGSGPEEHPTNAMADLYTLFKWRPDLLTPETANDDGLNIAILSTPAQSRNVSSFLLALTRFPQAVKRIVVFGRAARSFFPEQREMLEQAGLEVHIDNELYPNLSLIGGVKDVMPDTDIVYADRTRRWDMSRQDMLETMSVMKPGALVFHPQLRDGTVSEILDYSAHNGYFAQERNAVFIRKAVILSVLGISV